jgi:ATP-dependent DNA ligase
MGMACHASTDCGIAARTGNVFLYAFDLIELDRDDLRREPIEHRKATLAKLLRHTKGGLRLNEHIDEPGDVVFRSRHWIKSKKPKHPAVKREAEEDWGK